MNRLAVFAGILVLGAAFEAGAGSQPWADAPSDQQRFLGSWRLVLIDAGGKPDPNRGPHPRGMIYYDASGHMGVQIVPDRPRPSWTGLGAPPTLEEAREAVIGFTAYYGTYTVDEKQHTVTHHREGALNLGTPDLVRNYEFNGDRLILTPLNSNNHLVWERIR